MEQVAERVRERPIIFDADSVRAILDGTKSVTRRVVKPQPLGMVEIDGAFYRHKEVEVIRDGKLVKMTGPENGGHYIEPVRCPYGMKGDYLWVREAWKAEACRDELKPSELNRSLTSWWWLADGASSAWPGATPGRYRSPRFMPRWASRLLLEVTDVRVERLQAISEEDAEAEGCGACVTKGHRYDATDEFAVLWNRINGKRDNGAYAWANSPWVWVVAFKVVEP